METVFRRDEYRAFNWMGFEKNRNFTGYGTKIRFSAEL
jgi:hypothetical protein